MPAKSNSGPSFLKEHDPINREIEFTPTKTAYDPRNMISGRISRLTNETWDSGFFDRNSWTEIMDDYAKMAVVGRARLGGIAVGVIAVESRNVEIKVPADIGELESKEKTIDQKGNFLYVDAAQKIVQALNCFDREELPLFIFGNWHGISSGQSDMLNGILKFSSAIVDAMREYKQPVLVYLPPHAEMKGETWGLFETFVNPQFIEMYADATAKACVSDPENVVERQFKSKDLRKMIHRMDTTVIDVSLVETI